MNAIETLQHNIGYVFKDKNLLMTALTHGSYPYREMKETAHNQRLEYFGDAVFQLFVSRMLYLAYPEVSEAELTLARAYLVCEESLSDVAEQIGLPPCILMSNGEEANGARSRPSMLCDCMEALAGAVCLDGGLEAAERMIESLLRPKLEQSMRADRNQDAKTALQIICEKEGTVSYRIVREEGPDHDKIFWAEALINDRVIGEGKGHKKKQAEKEAAIAALHRLREEEYASEKA